MYTTVPKIPPGHIYTNAIIKRTVCGEKPCKYITLIENNSITATFKFFIVISRKQGTQNKTRHYKPIENK